MDNPIIFADSIIFVASIFALAFFCTVKPNIKIARYFYLIFGISVLPVEIVLVLEEGQWYLIIWPLLFSLVGILGFIGLNAKVKELKSPEEEKEFNEKFQQVAIRGGKRRILKNIKK